MRKGFVLALISAATLIVVLSYATPLPSQLGRMNLSIDKPAALLALITAAISFTGHISRRRSSLWA